MPHKDHLVDGDAIVPFDATEADHMVFIPHT